MNRIILKFSHKQVRLDYRQQNVILHSWYQSMCHCIDSVEHLLPLSMHVVHLFCVSSKVDESLNFCHLGTRCTTCMNAFRLSNTGVYAGGFIGFWKPPWTRVINYSC